MLVSNSYKNLMFSTKLQNVQGLGDPTGSQRAYDLFVKVNQLYAKNGRGQGVVFATGTPVSNSLAEMYHMMRYLMPAQMEELGFQSFDAWANTFASVEQVWMQKPSGDGFKASNRMSNFVNTPELLHMFDQVSDTVTMADIKAAYSEENQGRAFPIPPLATGRRQPVSLEKSPAQVAYMEELAERAKKLEERKGPPQKGEDNVLVIMSDGRKAAMDIRLVDMNATEREKGGRIDRAADEALKRYRKFASVKGTQLFFSDLGTPLKHAKGEQKEYEALRARIDAADEDTRNMAALGNEAAQGRVDDAEAAQAEMDAKGSDWMDSVKAALRGFSVYDDLKAALMERGVPEHEIAFIHDYNTDEQKAGLFRKVNAGDIRFVVGSTAKMGAGTNVQERLVALHHLDVPWRPSDVEQREGRIVRQGNKLLNEIPDFHVEVVAYVTQDTLDMRMWQVQETKLKMINQLRTRKIAREIDNAFEDMEMSASEMQAAATGNPDLLAEIQLKTEVKRLENRKRSFDAQQSDLQNRKRTNAQQLRELPAKIKKATGAAAAAEAYSKSLESRYDGWKVTIDGKDYTEPSAAGKYLQDTLEAAREPSKEEGKPGKALPIRVTMNGTAYTSRSALADAYQELTGDREPIRWTVDGKALIGRTAIASAIRQNVADAIAEETAKPAGNIGGFDITVEGGRDRFGNAVLDIVATNGDNQLTGEITVGSLNRQGELDIGSTAGAAGRVVQKVEGMIEGAPQELRYDQRTLERAEKVRDELAKSEGASAWPEAGKLDEARAKHREVLDRLSKTKKPEATPAADGDAPAFSQDDTRTPERRASDKHVGTLQQAIDEVVDGWAMAPGVTVLPELATKATPREVLAEAKARLQAGGAQPKGVLHQGHVYLFADRLADTNEATKVLFHEILGHYGLRNTYGPELKGILQRVAALRPAQIQAQLKQMGVTDTPANRLRAAEEVLAYTAQERPELTFVQSAVAAVRSWLRNRMPRLFGDMKLTDAEIIRDFILPARRYVEGGGGPRGGLPYDDDMAFSQDTTAQAAPMNDPRDYLQAAMRAVNDRMNAPGVLSKWHTTVGTQFNLAERSPHFKKVFDRVQSFLGDVSAVATSAADLAPRLLPKLDAWADIVKKQPISAEDTKAIAAPIFEGTLTWARDAAGKPVKLADVEAQYEGMSSDRKARMLMANGKATEAQMKEWQALPIDQYETAVGDAFERAFLRGGVVWTDAELRSLFGANDSQIELYREFRAATDKSLTDLAISDMLRLAGKDAEPIAEMVRAAPTGLEAAEMLRDYLVSLGDAMPNRKAVLHDTANQMIDKADRLADLIEHGYAPLSRFGTYTVDALDENGERLYFGLFETKGEAAKMARKLAAENPGADIVRGTVSQEEYKLFAGVSPETVELFGEMLGLDAIGDDASAQAFQAYLKLAKSNRSAMKRLIQRKGIAGFSEDASRVLAGFVYSNARQAARNLHQGDIDRAVSEIPKGQGELKDAAVRLTDYVKNPQEEAQAIRGLLFAQYLGGSLASAMVNMTQPVAVTMPYLSQFGGVRAAAAQMKNAVRDAARASTGDAALDEALKKAADEGIVAPQEVHHLMAQAQGQSSLQSGDGTTAGNLKALGNNTLSKVQLAWGKFFSMAELANRRITFIAAYRTAVAEGMADPAKFAAETINQTQFVYNKGNKPRWARGAVGGTLFTFKTYSVSYVELIHRMATQGGPEGKKAAIFALAVLFLMGGSSGLPFVEDVEDVADAVAQRLGFNFSAKTARRRLINGVFGEALGEFLDRGVSGMPGVPIDVSGRLGMGNLIPGTGLLLKKRDHSRDMLELLGPAGDLVQRGFQGASAIADGEVVKGAMLMTPIAARNVQTAIDMYSTGMYRDRNGRKVIDTDGYEALTKAIGFNPNSVAKVQEATIEQQKLIGQARLRESEIAAKWAQAAFEGDQEGIEAAREAVRRWNAKNEDTPIVIKPAQIQKRVKEMRKSKAERIAATAPAEIRAGVRRELQSALEP